MKRTVKTLEVSRMMIPKGTLLNTVPASGLPSKLFLKGSNARWALELDGVCDGASVVLTSHQRVFSVLANDVVFTGSLQWYVDDEATPLSPEAWDEVLEAQNSNPQLWYRKVSYHGALFDLANWTERGELVSYAPLPESIPTTIELQTTQGDACVIDMDQSIYADESRFRLCAAMSKPVGRGLRPGYVPMLSTVAACADKTYFDYVICMAAGPVSHKILSCPEGMAESLQAGPFLGFWYNLESGNGRGSLRLRSDITQIKANFTIGGLISPRGLGICVKAGDGTGLDLPLVRYDVTSQSSTAELTFDCNPLFVPGPNRGTYLPKVLARTLTNWGKNDTYYIRGVEATPFVWKRTGELYDSCSGFLSRFLDVDIVPGTVTVECDPLGSSDYGLRVQYVNRVPNIQITAGNRTSVTVQQGLRMIAKVSVSEGGHVVADVIARCKVGANQAGRFTELVNLDGSPYTLSPEATTYCRSLMVYSRLDSSWFSTDPDAYAIGYLYNFSSTFPLEDGNYVETDLGWT